MGKRGPRSEAGRAAVRLNPVKHGVLSQTPVIPLVEREEDWVRLRAGIFEYFGVEGMMEEALADQVAMLIWRRYRLVRFETESIMRYLEEVPGDYGRMRGGEEEQAAAAVQEMDRMVSARLLPGAETSDKILRYETRLHRFLLQTIHQLLVLQGLRRNSTMGGDDDEVVGRIRPSRPRALRPTETKSGGIVGLTEGG